MKELFRKTFDVLKKDKQVWILAILIYCLIMTIGLALSLVLGFGELLLIVFVVCPFIFTFIKLSIKGIDNLPTDNKDVYLGYKDMSRSISIVIRKLIKPVLLCFIFYFGLYVLISFGYIYIFEMDLIKELISLLQNSETLDVNTVIQMINNDQSFMNSMLICNYISLGLTLIILNILSNKKIFTFIFFMCINSTRINYDYIVNRKVELKKYNLFLYNIFVSLFYVLGLALAVALNFLLNSIIDNTIIAYLFSAFVFFVVSGFAIPFKYIAYTHLFNEHFNIDVENLIKERTMNK